MDIRRWKMGSGRVGAGDERGEGHDDLQKQLRMRKWFYGVNCDWAHHVNGYIWQWGPSLVTNLRQVSNATAQWVVNSGSNLH